MPILQDAIRALWSRCVVTVIWCSCIVIIACGRPSPSLERPGKEERLGHRKITLHSGEDPVIGARPVDAVIELQILTERKEQGVLADEIKLGDQKGNWQTEAFHESVKERLKILGKTIETRDWNKQRNTVISDAFECSDLRPDTSQLDQVFTDENLSVFRSSGTLRTTSTYTGIAGLSDSLRRLTSPFSPTSTLTVNFKVYKVKLNRDLGELEMHVDTDGFGKAGGVQQNMVWFCGWRRAAEDGWKLSSIKLMRFEEVHYRRSEDGKLFSDCTASVLSGNECFRAHLRHGINHWRLRFESRYKIDYAALTGLAIGDVNGDGLDDLYFCDVGGLPNRLLVQQADGTVADCTTEAGVDWLDRSYGALFADLDNDGDQDLIVSVDVSLMLMRNDGNGRFEVATQLRPNPFAQSLSVVDFDNDGLLDIYVCSYGNNYETFADDIAPLPYHDANNGVPNTMFHNRGNWEFHDVTESVGLNENNRKYSLGASWEDFDNDGDQDVYVANDFGSNNLYVNDMNRSGRFVDHAKTYEVEDFSQGMSVDWSDYDNDGWMDLYVGNMFSGAGNRIAFQNSFRVGASDDVIGHYRRFARGNALFRNGHTPPMGDVSIDAGVSMGRWAWSSVFADVNNDGWQDLLVANGHVTGVDPDDL